MKPSEVKRALLLLRRGGLRASPCVEKQLKHALNVPMPTIKFCMRNSKSDRVQYGETFIKVCQGTQENHSRQVRCFTTMANEPSGTLTPNVLMRNLILGVTALDPRSPAGMAFRIFMVWTLDAARGKINSRLYRSALKLIGSPSKNSGPR